MSRTLRSFIVALVLAGVCFWLGSFSQAANPKTGKARVGGRRRPKPRPMRVEKLSPQLERILKDWSAHSGTVKKLQGKHTRFEYDKTWREAKVAVGDFYYEAPDKGRIDLRGANLKKVKITRKEYKAYQVTAAEPERWICDGKRIMRIDDKLKRVDIFEVPPQARNQNIMDGPLPFLLGMPPNKAKKRFIIELKKETATRIVLKIKPKWQQDAANWSRATVILDKTNEYLPVAVQMFDPAGNRETVYRFSDLIRNKKPLLRRFRIVRGKGKDLFNPPLRKYKKNFTPAVTPNNVAKGKVPSVIGKSAKQAKKVLLDAGYEIKWERGDRPPAKQLNHIIYDQRPRGKSSLPMGKKVWIKYYCHPRKRTVTKPKPPGSKAVR